MKCPQCEAENPDGKKFCSDCGTRLGLPLQTLVQSQIKEYIQEHLKDQTLVEVETTEAIAVRFQKWGKLFLIPATLLLSLLALTLAFFGISDYSDFRKTVHRATDELRPKLEQAIGESEAAHQKALDAEAKADDALKSISAATAKMNAQLASAQQLSNRVSGLESQNANQITSASKHVEERVTDLDKKVEAANKEIAAQQGKLTSTNELVTAMFSKGQTEIFPTTLGNTPTYAVYSTPGAQNGAQQGAMVYMLLRSAPIYQTVELQFHVATQPKYSYSLQGNVLIFNWGDPAESLKQHPLVVSYVPDPTFHGASYSALSVKDGHVFADGVKMSP